MINYFVFALFLILCGCSSMDTEKKGEESIADEQEIHQQPHAPITDFLGFSSGITIPQLLAILDSSDIVYYLNPFKAKENVKIENLYYPSASIGLIDCDKSDFVFVPVFDFANFKFRNLFFAFYENSLALISINEPHLYMDNQIAELKSKYIQKYGAPYKHPDMPDGWSMYSYNYISKENNNNSVMVLFSRISNIDDKSYTDEFAIYFDNYQLWRKDCDKSSEIKESEEKNEKKIMDNI